MSRFLRNCLCFIGWHRYEFTTVTDMVMQDDGTFEHVVRDRARCMNWQCASHGWFTVNVDRRRLW